MRNRITINIYDDTTDADAVAAVRAKMVAALREIEAPVEQFERLGLAE